MKGGGEYWAWGLRTNMMKNSIFLKGITVRDNWSICKDDHSDQRPQLPQWSDTTIYLILINPHILYRWGFTLIESEYEKETKDIKSHEQFWW